MHRQLFLFILFAFAACSTESQKEDFVARVNDKYLTREDLASLVDTSDISQEQRDEIINSWIYKELIFQEAEKNGITSGEEYIKLVKNSSRQLAAAMMMQKFLIDNSIEIKDEQLIKYYDHNKNYFRADNNCYIINKVFFKDKSSAIKFRSLALENNWHKVVDIFKNDSLFDGSLSEVLVYQNDIYPLQLARIIQDINTDEISIVITEKPDYYSVVQVLSKYSANTVLPLDAIRDEVMERLIAEERSIMIEEYLKEIYSENEIEIKK